MNVKELIFGGIVKTTGGGAWRDSIQAWLNSTIPTRNRG